MTDTPEPETPLTNISRNPQPATTILVVDDAGVGTRLDAWASARLEKITRSRLKKIIDQGHVQVNGKKVPSKFKLALGDEVSVRIPPTERSFLKPKKLPLNILYEDDHIIVINKSPGIVVHPGAGDTGTTLVEGLLYYFGEKAALAKNNDTDGWMRPGVVHRLDKDTSGVLVCAKTDEALSNLCAQFAAKTNVREYYALLNSGRPARKPRARDISSRSEETESNSPSKKSLAEAIIDNTSSQIDHESFLYRDPTSRLKFASMSVESFEAKFPDANDRPSKYRWAKSSFFPKAQFGSRILLAGIRLHTGRTHQIRVHSQDLHAAVLGDPLYGRQIQLPLEYGSEMIKKVRDLKRQMLHAKLLGFRHPQTNEEMVFEAEFPEDFLRLLKCLEPFQIDI